MILINIHKGRQEKNINFIKIVFKKKLKMATLLSKREITNIHSIHLTATLPPPPPALASHTSNPIQLSSHCKKKLNQSKRNVWNRGRKADG